MYISNGQRSYITNNKNNYKYQGDSLSPLLFCMALSHYHKTWTELIVDIKYTELSYLLYMDGLKLRGRSEEDLENELKSVVAICSDINMDLD